MKIQNLAWLGLALCLSVSSVPAGKFFRGSQFRRADQRVGFSTQIGPGSGRIGQFVGTASTSEGDLMGAIFKIQSNGTGFQVLMRFSQPVDFTNSAVPILRAA